ncbi:MAG: beta-ketoacyl-ACP synthase III [Bacteroidia bacterium]
MPRTRASITAVNGWVPDFVLTNKILETMVDTNDEWIQSRTGIKERRILRDKDKATSDIGANAVNGLLKKRGIAPEEIELLICCTTTPDMQFPATANIICDKTGLKNAFSYDLNAACSGFLFGLSTGAKFIESGTYKKVIVVGADKMSSIVDYKDRSTCILFGDGGGAVLLEPNNDGYGIMDEILRTDGSGRTYLHQKAGGSLRPASHNTVDAGEHFIYQDGQPVFKFAVKGMADVSAEILQKNNLTAGDIAWLVPHQANKRIIDATARRMGLPDEKVMLNIQRYGNTTNGTIPLCLSDYETQLHKGDNIIISAFGGGFTWGAVWVKWAHDS